MDDLNGKIDPSKLKLKVTCFQMRKEITLIMKEIWLMVSDETKRNETSTVTYELTGVPSSRYEFVM